MLDISKRRRAKITNVLGPLAYDECDCHNQANIGTVQEVDIIEALRRQFDETLALLAPIGEEKASQICFTCRQWTLKQVIGHIADDERIYCYLVLCIARDDSRRLPSFQRAEYVKAAHFDDRSVADLLNDLWMVRQGTLALLRGLGFEMWTKRGIVGGHLATVRDLASKIAAHELHHVQMIRRKYLHSSHKESSGQGSPSWAPNKVG